MPSSSRTTTTLPAIKGQKVNLVELSVSHYLLARALDSVGLKEADITVVNTSDADMVAAYATPDVTAVVTWNPLVSTILEGGNANKVFNSTQIPGEIIDIMMVNTETLKDNPNFGKALVGAWYEMMGIMSKDDDAGKKARTAMAEASGTDLAGYDAQLATTAMFYDPAKAVAFNNEAKLIETMQVRRPVPLRSRHSRRRRQGARISLASNFPAARRSAIPKNIKLRFDPSFMTMAAEGKL